MKPFKYGCVVDADFFCPRPLLQNRLAEYVRDGQNVVLVGERRMGKTSLVFAVCKALRGYRMLYVDLLNIRTVSDFCNRVATAAAQMGRKSSFGSRAMSFISRLRPTLSIDPDNGMPVISVDTMILFHSFSGGLHLESVRPTQISFGAYWISQTARLGMSSNCAPPSGARRKTGRFFKNQISPLP